MEKSSLLVVVFSLAAVGTAHGQVESDLAAATPATMVRLESRTSASENVPIIRLPSSEIEPGVVASVESSSPSRPQRPKALVPLYVFMAALQASDAVSTRLGLAAGGREANPLVAPFVGSTVGLAAMKAAAAASMIYGAERLWKRNRKAAVLMLVVTTVGYGAVVSHNMGIARN